MSKPDTAEGRARRRKLASKIDKTDYKDPRDHYIRSRMPLSLGLLAEVWGLPDHKIAQKSQRDRNDGRDWDVARANYQKRINQEAREIIVTQVAKDESDRQSLYRQHAASVFTLTQALIGRLTEDYNSNRIDPTDNAKAILNLQRLQKCGSDCWNLEERIFGIPALRQAEQEHLEDLRAIRDAACRTIEDPTVLAAFRREVDTIIIRRERESAAQIAERENLLEDEAFLISKLDEALNKVEALEQRIEANKLANRKVD